MEELNHWHQYRYKNYNSIIIGAGITGLSMAMWLKIKNPKEKILVCDKGMDMASRRNAGFVTSGSLKYLLNMIDNIGKDNALAVWKISKKNRELIENFILINDISELVQYKKLGSTTYLDSFSDFYRLKELGFEQIKSTSNFDVGIGVFDPDESSFNPIRFHDFLLNFVINLGVEVDLRSEVKELTYKKNGWKVSTRTELRTKKLLIATNSSSLLNTVTSQNENIIRTRAQIQSYQLSAKKEDSGNIYIPSKKIYYKVSNNKLIIGGLRVVDPENELTDTIGINDKIQDALKEFVLSNIDRNAIIENKWSGIMGMRTNELPKVYFDIKRSLFFIGGYSGHGNAFAFYLAKELIESIALKKLTDDLRRFTSFVQ